MTSLNDISSILVFARKLFSLQNAELYFLALPGAMGLAELLQILVGGASLKELILPLVVAGVCLGLYFVTFLLDFVSGVRASHHEAEDKKNFFSSANGWSSMWKLATVFLLVTWSSVMAIFAVLAGLGFLYKFFLLASGTMSLMAALLDVHSIGENQKRLTGKKAKFFEWLESLMNIINQGVMERLKRFF